MIAASRPLRLLALEPRPRAGVLVRVAVPLGSILAAGVVGALILALAGASPLEAYREMFRSAFGGSRPVIRTLVLATPLILTGLAAAICFRMLIWNIGAEGQLIVGAIAASGVALAVGDDMAGWLAIVLMVVAGTAAGGVWALLAAVPRAYLRTDEVISTLMLNFIALHLMNYLVFGSVSFWRDAERLSFPQGKVIPETTMLPALWGRLHVGIIVAGVAAVLVWWVIRGTRWGFELRVIGDSPGAARYAGMNVGLKILGVMAVSGALAGLAGAIEVGGVTRALDPGSLSTGLGFTGIVVAAVARLNPLGIVPTAILLAGLLNSGSSLQQLGIPFEAVLLLQGVILLLVAGGEFVLSNRIRLRRRVAVAAEPARETP
jgi:general nucleoside transport system permease protein